MWFHDDCIRRNSLSANNDNPCLVSAFQLTSGYVSSVLNTCICSSHSKQEVDTFQCRKEFWWWSRRGPNAFGIVPTKHWCIQQLHHGISKCILTKSSSTTGYISSVISACLQCILDPDGCKKNCISIAVSAGRNSFPPMLGIHSTPVRQDLKVHFDNSPNTTGCISCHFGLLAMHSWIQTDVKNCISIAVSARQKMYSQRVRCIQTISKVHWTMFPLTSGCISNLIVRSVLMHFSLSLSKKMHFDMHCPCKTFASFQKDWLITKHSQKHLLCCNVWFQFETNGFFQCNLQCANALQFCFFAWKLGYQWLRYQFECKSKAPLPIKTI